MAVKGKIERASLSDWQAESFRLTAFPSSSGEISSQGWWKRLLEEEPETQITRSKIGDRIEQGTFHDANLTLRIQPDRIDWALRIKPPEEEPPVGFLTVGKFEEACSSFCDLIKRWFPLSPPLKRLAFGTIVLLPVSSRKDGYIQLSPYLGSVKLDPENTSDFLYRINRPRASRTGIKDLRINRLTTWAVARFESRQFVMRKIDIVGVEHGEPAFACRIEMDVNTITEIKGSLSSKHLDDVFSELVELSHEIITNGDRP